MLILLSLAIYNYRTAARDDTDPSKPPLLMDLTGKNYSLFAAVLQYYATLLVRGSGSGRLMLVWRRLGYKSFQHWCASAPEQVRYLRRVTLMAAGWVHRRHWLPIQEAPLCLVSFADACSTEAEFSQLSSRWSGLNQCCVRPGMGCCMKERGLTSKDFLELKPCPQECFIF